MIFYIAYFAFSLGVMTWLIISEVFPLKIRGLATSLAIATTRELNTVYFY